MSGSFKGNASRRKFGRAVIVVGLLLTSSISSAGFIPGAGGGAPESGGSESRLECEILRLELNEDEKKLDKVVRALQECLRTKDPAKQLECLRTLGKEEQAARKSVMKKRQEYKDKCVMPVTPLPGRPLRR